MKEKIKRDTEEKVTSVTKEELREIINELQDGTMINIIFSDADEDNNQN